jgi:hypothetical protein
MCFFRKKKKTEEKRAEEKKGTVPGIPDTYLDFPHRANTLSLYMATNVGLITLRLNDGTHIHYFPKDMRSFINWLDAHNVPDARKPFTF